MIEKIGMKIYRDGGNLGYERPKVDYWWTPGLRVRGKNGNAKGSVWGEIRRGGLNIYTCGLCVCARLQISRGK